MAVAVGQKPRYRAFWGWLLIFEASFGVHQGTRSRSACSCGHWSKNLLTKGSVQSGGSQEAKAT